MEVYRSESHFGFENTGNTAISMRFSRRSLTIAVFREALNRLVLRLFEILVGLFCLIITSPILLIVAIIIRIDSPGPAIFRQTRIGRHLKPFTFYKFRTFKSWSL